MQLPEGSLLKPYVEQRLGDLAKAKAKRSPGQAQGAIGELPQTRGFRGALAYHYKNSGKAGIIAEIKGGTPFENMHRRPPPYKALAEDFEVVGAVCLSIAVERRFFAGSYADLRTVQHSVKVPLLAQDIIIDFYQLLEARNAGADACLLSVAVLGPELPELIQRARTIALDPLVQVHTREEIDQALAAGADFICVTNRNIHTFALVPGTCEALLPLLSADKVVAVAEGGFGTAEDRERLGQAGAKGIIMGNALMSDADPAGVLERVLGVESPPEDEAAPAP